MKIAFRVDSSLLIGSGHLMRCLVLAERFQKLLNAKVYFITRNLQGNLNSLIVDRGFELLVLPNHELEIGELIGYEIWLSVPQLIDAEETNSVLEKIQDVQLLVVDSYAISAEWENFVKPYTQKIMIIDDLANRSHECDYILDQSYAGEKVNRYCGLLPLRCKVFLGVSYVLLHESYYLQQAKIRNEVHDVLAFFGGSDDTGETLKFISAINLLGCCTKLQFVIVVGYGNPDKDKIRQLCNRISNVRFYCQVDNMAELIARADVAFGAAGSNLWERCFLGLPAVVTVTADNQRFIAEQVNNTGAIKILGWHESVNVSIYKKALLLLEELPLDKMSRAAFSVIGKSCIDEMIATIKGDLQ